MQNNRFASLVNQIPKRTLICLNCYCWAVLCSKLAYISSPYLYMCVRGLCVHLTTNLIEVSITLLAESMQQQG